MAVGSSNDFDLVVLGAGTGGYAAAFRAPSSASRSPSSTRTRSAARASIAAASRPRRCSSRRPSPSGSATPRTTASSLPGRAGRRLRRDGRPPRRRRQAPVDRPQDAHRQEQGDLGRRPRPARRPGQGQGQPAGRGRHAGRGGDRVLNATDVIIATGSRVKSLPGLTPDGKRIVTSDDVLKMDTLPKDIVIVGAGAVGVEFASMFARRRRQGHAARVPAADRPARGRRGQQAARAQLHQARHDGHDQRPLRRRRRSTADDGRHLPDGRARGQGAGRAARRDDARRHRPRRQHRGHRPRDAPRSRPTAASSRSTARCGPRSRTSTRSATSIGGLWLAHTAAHEGIIAAHTIAGDADVHEMDYTDAAAGDLLPPGDRLDRADRGAVRRSAASRSRSARSRSRRSPRRSSAASTRASPRSSPTRRPTTRSASTSSGRTPPTSSPRRRSASTLEATPWEIGARDPRPPDALGGHRRGGDGRRRAVAQLLGAGRPSSRHRDEADRRRPRPGQRPRRRRRPVRRGPRRDVPAGRARAGRRRADVDPQPGRPDPVRHQRPGPRGRAGRDRLGAREGPRLDRAVLPLDRDLPDVRDERRATS